MKKFFSYENGIVGLMALTFGVLFFDRLALNYLVPYVAKDLNLNNTQIGLLAAGLSLAWAFSSYFTTAWSEAKNKNKITFILSIVIFSVCSFGSGMAIGFGTLLVARLVMGLAEGPVIPLAQIFVERESSPSRLGINVGIVQAVGGALFGSILAPVILIQIAENMGWRTAFYIAGVPGLFMGVLAAIYLKNSTTESRGIKEKNGFNIKELWQYNNIKWGTPLACCVFGWWFATIPFITKYFTDVQGMDAGTMQKTMGLLGLSMLLSSLFFPGISDKIGRKKALLIALCLGIVYPFAVYFLNGTGIHLPAMFITYAMVGTIPLVAAIVPSEAVPNRLKAKAVGFVTAVAEIVGGVLIPAIAGGLSDVINESAFLWVATVLAVLSLFFLSKLEETKGKEIIE
ncbi:MFS transporter [Maribacter sp. MAR_2009_72]|uniref:MFS transporter n=1 Tax=Maribacter sp. MAR_2009_72 TaxID=1250050 RepID=UPI00119C6087|nr:MFS transporter [Maribacter sp. MAR_2009_72]TVZ15988.1 putative MFS family arabinose efflux permease [Maribacter sp. MAR_2009_72]